jgi:hypothetical protein
VSFFRRRVDPRDEEACRRGDRMKRPRSGRSRRQSSAQGRECVPSLARGIGSIGALWFSRRNQPLSACRIIPVEVADFTING